MFGEHTPAGVWEAEGGMRPWLEKPAQISVQQSPVARACTLRLISTLGPGGLSLRGVSGAFARLGLVSVEVLLPGCTCGH